MNRLLAVTVMLLALAALECRAPLKRRVVRLSANEGVVLRDVVIAPTSAVAARRLRDDVLELEVVGDAPLEVTAPTACPITLAPTDVEAKLVTVIRVPRDLPQVGFDAPFRLLAEPRCDRATHGTITWHLEEGALAQLASEAPGFALRGRTIARPSFDVTWGIVPISPRTRGAALVVGTWTDGVGTLRLETRIAAAARATGVSSIAVGQEVHLAGSGWKIVATSPKNVTPTLEQMAPGLFRYRADQIGQASLLDGAGHPLSIRAGTHERVPLDCGRSDCHRATTQRAQSSAMTHVLRNALEGAYGEYTPSCAVGCHAVGEPGLHDEGFVDVARGVGFEWPHVGAGAWNEVPRALRRLGGVGCTTCHGPAAIPEPTARFAILRADVCATCHDAPPRYPLVESWRSSAMARADRDDVAATDPACTPCHTTAGFLRTLSNAPREDAPRDVRPVGIACAACHAPHGEHVGRLVREVKVPSAFDSLEPRSRICVSCHLGGAATVWAGRDGARSPHASLGCVSCHGPAHDFRVDLATCRSCHPNGVDPKGPPRAVATPAAHAARMRVGGAGNDLAAAAAEDRGAWVHNARVVRALGQ